MSVSPWDDGRHEGTVGETQESGDGTVIREKGVVVYESLIEILGKHVILVSFELGRGRFPLLEFNCL